MPIRRLNAEEKEETYGASWPVSKTSMDTAEKRFKRQVKKCDDARKTARDQCSPVGRVKKGMPEAFERWSLKANPIDPDFDNVFINESFGETLEFAESLGWVDTFPDSSDPDYSPEMADGIEQDALEYIARKGYTVVEPT